MLQSPQKIGRAGVDWDLLVAAGEQEEIAPTQTPGKTVAMAFLNFRVLERQNRLAALREPDSMALMSGRATFPISPLVRTDVLQLRIW